MNTKVKKLKEQAVELIELGNSTEKAEGRGMMRVLDALSSESVKNIIVLENFHTPTVCTDTEGDVIYFESLDEAYEYAEENCQCGTVVQVNSF